MFWFALQILTRSEHFDKKLFSSEAEKKKIVGFSGVNHDTINGCVISLERKQRTAVRNAV